MFGLSTKSSNETAYNSLLHVAQDSQSHDGNASAATAPSLLGAEAELYETHLTAALNSRVQRSDRELDAYQDGLVRNLIASPKKLRSGLRGPPLSIATISMLFSLIEHIAKPTDASTFLEQGNGRKPRTQPRADDVRVQSSIVIPSDSSPINGKHTLRWFQIAASAARLESADRGSARIVIQPWWQSGRWRAAVLDNSHLKPVVTLVDPWNLDLEGSAQVCFFH